ncbi:thioesterase [Actinomadura craniellae]|uniref:Thioesterase n=1 Tax=Actinomadura craniellae TaxID=2231787 RepID=A0A365HCG7_9ACTN|nr:alpha/beta fold hydrolase [Actinomadura craniellae]RAY16626.1 thioesterase [Actinomadura craniellae]
MSWLRCPEPRPWASLRLFCFPHAGGSAAFYRPWSRRLPAAVEMHIVQYPGRADRMRDPFVDDMGRLARLVAGELGPLLDRPVALFGHSMGAVLAYEVARLLQERGNAPGHLFASASRPPHRRGAGKNIAGLDDDALVAELAELGGTDVELLRDPELRELVLPYVRNDFALIEAYTELAGPRLGVPVTALVGDADPRVDATGAGGWAEATDGAFALRTFEGDHFYLVPRREQVIAEILRALHVPAGP